MYLGRRHRRNVGDKSESLYLVEREGMPDREQYSVYPRDGQTGTNKGFTLRTNRNIQVYDD